ncbi:MAG: orotate phosphoribosyltransferase [Legionellales bacterium]|nr:orotate phosphoribosyltransferase [Legionellales bacterium]
MHDYQRQFIEFALQHRILRFGEFTLKSGRVSPYFFNSGLFNSGLALSQLGHFYAQTIQQARLSFDTLFGPAYKGIPLATTTAIALTQHYQHDVAVRFNRKEVKDHGEGGDLIGGDLQGRVLLIDDVITAGTAFHQAKSLIEQHSAQLIGAVIALDRQERGINDQRSAIQLIEQQYAIPVLSIIQLSDLVTYLTELGHFDPVIKQIHQYQQQYGI